MFTESRILVTTHRFMEEAYRFRNLAKDYRIVVNLARRLVVDYYSSSRCLLGKAILIDKEPLEPIAFPAGDYGRFIVNIRSLFPQCKLLLTVREPVAAIWSMTSRSWGSSLTSAEIRRFALEEYVENWSSCAELVVRYSADPNVHVVQYGRLLHDAEDESMRISRFLRIRNGVTFQPREPRDIGFSKETQNTILHMVQGQLRALETAGISQLA